MDDPGWPYLAGFDITGMPEHPFITEKEIKEVPSVSQLAMKRRGPASTEEWEKAAKEVGRKYEEERTNAWGTARNDIAELLSWAEKELKKTADKYPGGVARPSVLVHNAGPEQKAPDFNPFHRGEFS